MAYIDSMYDVMAMETGMLKMGHGYEHCPEELALPQGGYHWKCKNWLLQHEGSPST